MTRETTTTQLRSVGVELCRLHMEYVNDSKVFSQSEDQKAIATPLLDQLRDAVAPSKKGNSTGGAPGYSSKAPLNLGAVSLLREIGDSLKGYPGETLEDQIDFLIDETIAAGTDRELEELLRQLRSYAGRIRQLLDGPKKRLNISCNECGQSWILNDEGVRELAHTYYEGEVECLSCGSKRNVIDYWALLQAIKD